MCGIVLAAVSLSAETPASPASEPGLTFTATTANVAGAPDSIRIDILRWSTDEEREKLMSAWNGKDGADGQSASGRAGRRWPGKDALPPSTVSPEVALAAALKETTTVGYLWSSEVSGYALRYAGKVTGADGQERIILITQRHLGAMNDLWKVVDGDPPAAYDFSVIELRVDAKGKGAGKVSLTGKVAPDSALNMIALENYSALPVVLSSVTRKERR
jgi:hypothetical protein